MEAKTEAEEFKVYLESQVQSGWYIVISELENRSSKPITLIAEPYATNVVIPPGGECEIMAEEPYGHAIHLTVSDNYIQVWACGLIETFQDGVGYGTTSDFLEWREELRERTK